MPQEIAIVEFNNFRTKMTNCFIQDPRIIVGYSIQRITHVSTWGASRKNKIIVFCVVDMSSKTVDWEFLMTQWSTRGGGMLTECELLFKVSQLLFSFSHPSNTVWALNLFLREPRKSLDWCSAVEGHRQLFIYTKIVLTIRHSYFLIFFNVVYWSD